MLNLGPLVLGTVLTLAAVITALVVSRRADSEWAPVAVVGGGTVLGLAALALAIAVTTSATDADNQTPPSTEAARAAATPTRAPTEAGPPSPTSNPTPPGTATATPTSTALTATPTPTPTATPPPVATEAVAGAPPTRWIATDEGGVRWRSACAPDALLPGWWPNGTAVEVMREGLEDCEGWSLVRSRSLVSWVSNESLAGAPPGAATSTPTPSATGTPDPTSTPATPTPTSIAPGGSYAGAIDAWIGRLRDIEAELDANFDQAVTDSDWVAASRNATRLGTAAVAVRTEVEQTAPFVAELAPDCRAAMMPLGEMAAALAQMAGMYQEWLADGLVDNEAGLRVSAEREAMRAAESDATTALEGCG